MKTRIATAGIGGILFLASLLFNVWSWKILIFLLAIVALKEWYKMNGMSSLSVLGVLGYFGAFGIIIGGVDVYFVMTLLFLASVVLSLRNFQTYHIGLLALFWFGLYYIIIGFQASVVWYESYGKWFVLYLILLIWSSDTFAYFTGYFFGKHKMAPLLSPKKTYEGLVGGIIGTVLLSYLLTLWMDITVSLHQSILIGLFVACAAPLGDLFESAVKRHVGVKDAGNLLPGHGGVLDRFDSFLFVMIAFQMMQLFL